jgi:hypothetical protein
MKWKQGEDYHRDCAGQSKSIPVPIQATGRVLYGPFEFTAPRGYWYFPRTYPEKGLAKGESFVVTFFQTKEDIPRDRSEYPKHAFLNLFIFSGEYKDYQAYYDTVINARRSQDISDNTFLRKDLPQRHKSFIQRHPQLELPRGNGQARPCSVQCQLHHIT